MVYCAEQEKLAVVVEGSTANAAHQVQEVAYIFSLIA